MNAVFIALKQESASSTALNKLKMHCIALTTFVVNRGTVWLLFIVNKCKKLQFVHTVNGNRSKTAKIIKRQY